MFKKSVLIVILAFIYGLFAKNVSLKGKYFAEEGSDPYDCGDRQSSVEVIFMALENCNTKKWEPLPEVKYPASNERLCCYSLEAVCLHKQVVSKYCKKDNEFHESFNQINNDLKDDCLKAGIKLSGQLCRSLPTNDLGDYQKTCNKYMPCSYEDKGETDDNHQPLRGQNNSGFQIKTLNTLLFSIVLLITISFEKTIYYLN